MAVLEGRKVGEGDIRLFIGIWDIERMGFGAPSTREGIARRRRIKAQVNTRPDGNNFNLRHLNCGMVDIEERGI